MEAGYRINHDEDGALEGNPTFILVYNFHGFNDIDHISTNNRNYAKVHQLVGCWNIKYKKNERK